MRRLASVLSVLALSVSCGESEPAPIPTSGAPATPPVALPAPVPPVAPPVSAGRPHDDVPALPGDGPSDGAPLLGIAPDGSAVAVVARGSETLAFRLEAGAWAPYGAAITCGGVTVAPTSLAIGAEGVTVAGTFVGADGRSAGCAVRGDGSTWTQLGGELGAAPSAIRDVAIVPGPSGLLALFTQHEDPPVLSARTWDGTAWQPLAGGSIALGAGASAVEDLVATGGATPFVGWRERHTGAPVTYEVRRWDGAAWQALPAVPHPDGDTRAVLAATPDGGVLCARTWNPGFDAVLRWAPGASDWTSLGAPAGVSLSHGMPALTATATGAPILAWADALVSVSAHDGTAWSSIASGLGRAPNIEMDVRAAAAPDGTLLVLWRESDSTTAERARVVGASFAPAEPR